MTRIRKEFKRSSGFRDAKLFVIASEGQKTETKYFENLVSPDYYYNPRTHLEVLRRETTSSSPKHVLKELNKFRSEYSLNKNDELWLIIDSDRWPPGHLSDVLRECHQKKYHVVVSNPCFELWLLLHLQDIIEEYTKIWIDKLTCKILKAEITKVLGSYNPSNLDISKFLPFVHNASSRAKNLNKDEWPNSVGTRLYLLVDKIIT